MEAIFADFREAQTKGHGPLLSTTLTPVSPPDDPNRLQKFQRSTNHFSVLADCRSEIYSTHHIGYRLSKTEGNAWVDIYVAYWKAIDCLLAVKEGGRKGEKSASWSTVYEAWKEVTSSLIRGYTNAAFQAWTVPCLYVTAKYLRVFAIKADEAAAKTKGNPLFSTAYEDDVAADAGKNEKLEDAARVINRIFTLCISDRAPIEESRKWGLYYTTNLLFKTYFKLNSIGLSKNILRALEASRGDMPLLEAFPKSHIVTFKYYVGVILFLEEDYLKAEENLHQAWRLCHKDARRNKELILTYLIPCHLVTTHTLPTSSLLSPYPGLQALFAPLSSCIKRGDLYGFDAALSVGEEEFVRRRIYLTLERGRDIALRNLFRRVFLSEPAPTQSNGVGETGSTRRTRIPVRDFGAAIRLSNRKLEERIEDDEVECLLATMIYKLAYSHPAAAYSCYYPLLPSSLDQKHANTSLSPIQNFMKGYIARERGMVVLSSKGNAFPGTGV
ncbi:MAG: COP9 signalosome (CSN) subunit [Caeruleum heppii]|nr:MAG: COP9 signalosome (CSN) subunit [Caeruleum heppii]